VPKASGFNGGELVDGGEDTNTVCFVTAPIEGVPVTTIPAAAKTAVADEVDARARIRDALAAVVTSKDVDLNSIMMRTDAGCKDTVTSDALAPGMIAAKALFIAKTSASLTSETSPATRSSAAMVYSVIVFPGGLGGDTTGHVGRGACEGLGDEPDGQLKLATLLGGDADGLADGRPF
jgi:hypothetical protein